MNIPSFENSPGKDPLEDKYLWAIVGLGEVRALLDREVPDEYLELWNKCRDEIDFLEEELKKGKEIIENLKNITEDDRELYEGFLVALKDQIDEVQKTLTQSEELYFKIIPEQVMKSLMHIKQRLEERKN